MKILYKPIPVHQAMKIPDANGRSRQGVGQARTTVSRTSDESQEQERGHRKKGTKRGKDSSLCDADGLVLPQELAVGVKVPKHIKDLSHSEVML